MPLFCLDFSPRCSRSSLLSAALLQQARWATRSR
jgi:hypothetical protein